MNPNFYNVAANFWGQNLAGCSSSCSNREKANPSPNEMPLLKPKKEYAQTFSDDLLNNSSININNVSQLSADSKENLTSELTSLSYPIKFSGNPKGKPWSKDEDELLKEAVKFFSGKNWKQIATKVPGRSSTQCSQRWRRIQPYKNRFPWNLEEDQLLTELVRKYGQNWSIIASSLPGRTGKQVRERFLNNLDPTINRNKFSNDEDEKIIGLYSSFGPRWKEMCKEFSGRTENMIKNRFYSHIKKKMLLKYPLKYKKALERAQTELSLQIQSSPKEQSFRGLKNESERISGKDDFSEFEEGFKNHFQQLESLTMQLLNKESTEFKEEIQNKAEMQLNENNFGNELMEVEDAQRNSDGFLNLYRKSRETPKKNQMFKSIFSPNQKMEDMVFDAPLIKHELEVDNNDSKPPNEYSKLESELAESKSTIINSFFNMKEFESNEIFRRSKTKMEEENPDDKLLSQKSYLLSKKIRLESMIKEIAGKIQTQSNSQNL